MRWTDEFRYRWEKECDRLVGHEKVEEPIYYGRYTPVSQEELVITGWMSSYYVLAPSCSIELTTHWQLVLIDNSYYTHTAIHWQARTNSFGRMYRTTYSLIACPCHQFSWWMVHTVYIDILWVYVLNYAWQWHYFMDNNCKKMTQIYNWWYNVYSCIINSSPQRWYHGIRTTYDGKA